MRATIFPGCILPPLVLLAAAAALARSAHVLHPYCSANNIDPNTYKPLENAKLVHVQTVFLHDDCSPFDVQSNRDDLHSWECVKVRGSPSLPEKSKCKKSSDLTLKGYFQMAERGKAFKAIYSDRLAFLPPDHSDAQLHVRSARTKKTDLSAHAFLAAAYPGLDWAKHSPIMHVGAEGRDTLSHQRCALRDDYWGEMMNSDAFKVLFNERDSWETNQRRAQQLPPKHRVSLLEVADNIMTRHCHNLPLPSLPGNIAKADDTVTEAQNWMKREVEFFHRKNDISTAFSRLQYGELINELREIIITKATGDSPLRKDRYKEEFYMQAMVGFVGAPIKHAGQAEVFFAHSDFFMAFLSLFRAADLSWPAYGSNLTIELWHKDTSSSHNVRVQSSDDDYYGFSHLIPIPKSRKTSDLDPYVVRILYNNQPLQLDDKWCDFAKGCPLTKFLTFSRSIIVLNHDKACARMA